MLTLHETNYHIFNMQRQQHFESQLFRSSRVVFARLIVMLLP